jgi:hypothetical protein
MRPSISWLNPVLALVLAATPMAARAAECRIASGPGTAALVELYTSEGCSSCPPADRWLSAFAGHRDPRVVPIAFHVQYWDSLGWKDRFGDPRYTGRQKDEGKRSGARFVYTPQVVVAGRDFPDWRSDSTFEEMIGAVQHRPARATLEIASRVAADGTISGSVTSTLVPGSKPANLALVVALVQGGLSSRVTAGENRGERLAHEFVTRDMVTAAPGAGRSMHDYAFKPRSDWDTARMSVTAFLQDTATGEVVQALAAPPCP